MKKLLVFLMIALLALAPCRAEINAEEMPLMDWSRPTPTAEPTPGPTPASYENFRSVELKGALYGIGRGFHPQSEIDILIRDNAAELEDLQFSWTYQPEEADYDGNWESSVSRDTDAGRTIYLHLQGEAFAEAYPGESVGTALWVFLPDIPELAGDQWISFRVGDERVTMSFRLTYLGDYQEDKGWELEDRGAAVTRLVALPATATPEPTPEPTPTPTPKPTPEPTATPRPIVLQENEIQDSWEEILAAIDDGTAKQRYAVGAWKSLTLVGIGTIDMQLAGFELDTLSDGTGKAATTWIAKELLPKKRRMNPGYDGSIGTGAIGGWESCELRAYLQDYILRAFPTVVRDRLQWVDKTQSAYDENRDRFTQLTSDNLWIPSREEVFGEDSLYYELFRDSAENRVKTQGQSSSASWWWLRSASLNNNFCTVTNGGSSYTNGANYTGGLAVGFCL